MRVKCPKCKKYKSRDKFYKDKRKKNGLYAVCKACHQKHYGNGGNVKSRSRPNFSKKQREQYNLAQAKWRKKNRKKQALMIKRWKMKNPRSWNAHAAVNRALKNGKLKRKLCEKCGAKKVHAHHEDYSKPLDVHWLCPMHHREAHKK